MILYFADRKFNILGMAKSTSGGMTVSDDLRTEELGDGGASMECTISFGEDRSRTETCTKPGNYLLNKSDRGTEFYTIIEVDINTADETVDIYAEEAGLDLLNEVVLEYEADQPYSIEYYINKYTADSGFQIRVNEISNLTRQLSWTNEQTAMERILDVAAQFDEAELAFDFEVKDLQIVAKYIDIYQKRGNENTGIELRMKRDISDIRITKTIENLATALYVTGGRPEGSSTPITLAGYTYDDGRFFLQGPWLKDRDANKVWSRYLSPGETGDGTGYIMGTYSYDTLSQSELCDKAVEELKKRSDMEVKYEVDIRDLPKQLRLGDTVNVVDNEGELYLSARISKLEISYVNETATATLGDFISREAGTSAVVEELAKQFASMVGQTAKYTWIAYADDENGTGISLSPDGKTYMGIASNQAVEKPDLSIPTVYKWSKIRGLDGENAILLQIDSSNGNIFKNSAVSTTLTVTVIVGDAWLDTSAKLKSYFGEQAALIWEQKGLGETEFTEIPSTDPRLSDNGFIFTLSTDDVKVRVVFNCKLDC